MEEKFMKDIIRMLSVLNSQIGITNAILLQAHGDRISKETFEAIKELLDNEKKLIQEMK